MPHPVVSACIFLSCSWRLYVRSEYIVDGRLWQVFALLHVYRPQCILRAIVTS